MEIIPSASVAIIDSKGRLLMVQRGHDPEKGRWSLPGGKLRPGETPEQAAVREAFEETGLKVVVERALPVENKPGGDDRVYQIHAFVVSVTAGDLVPSDDAADAVWADAETLDRLPLTTNLDAYLIRAGLMSAIAPNAQPDPR